MLTQWSASIKSNKHTFTASAIVIHGGKGFEKLCKVRTVINATSKWNIQEIQLSSLHLLGQFL